MKRKWKVLMMVMILLVLIKIVVPHEQYFIFYPTIDTRFAPTYKESNFKHIKVGMRIDDVIKLIGEPLEIDTLDYQYPNKESIYITNYTQDGKCTWGDFAWLDICVYYDKNWNVSEFGQAYRYD
jgi:outer membrane protein assembly factor BamE (lipoprotein component of BamABCDE complex)